MGRPRGERYAARFAALAATGADVHGEANLCSALVRPGARILDAGCGTGRVAVRLQQLGFDCVGVDVDPDMLEVARRTAGVTWLEADLSDLDLLALGLPDPFDLIVAAGNVVPLMPPIRVPSILARLAAHLRPDGLLVAGFGLDPVHLPPGAAVLSLGDYDRWCSGAGLSLRERHATWERAPYVGGGYAVSVHRRD